MLVRQLLITLRDNVDLAGRSDVLNDQNGFMLSVTPSEVMLHDTSGSSSGLEWLFCLPQYKQAFQLLADSAESASFAMNKYVHMDFERCMREDVTTGDLSFFQPIGLLYQVWGSSMY